jgi:hypothetical protein
MATDHEEDAAGTKNLGKPLLIAATFAAGAGAALAAKSVLASRRKQSEPADEPDAEKSDEDLTTALRRAALDVAVAATNEAAQRLDAKGGQPAPHGS